MTDTVFGKEPKYVAVTSVIWMPNRLRYMIRAVTDADCDVGVLSAFGCESSGNPPSEVAAIFKD